MSEPISIHELADGVSDISSMEHAKSLDASDPLSRFRSQFHIPSIADLKRKTLVPSSDEDPILAKQPCTYLCGNSLGLQPTRTAGLIEAFLTQWRTKAVTGHFVQLADSPIPPFVHVDDHAAKLMAPVVGVREDEVAVMGALTSNLHLMMSSFYRPERGRAKIMLEGQAFPSDHYAVESQIAVHGFDPGDSMVLLEPADQQNPILPTQRILDAIDAHSDELALILLPGIQFYTGQYFDIPTITKHAHAKGIIIGWDLAHAAGNVDLKLHDWDVDFACWCTYKYLNAGPGAMAGIFVNERYGKVEMDKETGQKWWPRLTGWWGDDKSSRFQMTNQFVPRPGAGGFQLSNPSALDITAVVASLQIFNETSMSELRERSIRLTGYLEQLLDALANRNPGKFNILTPRNPSERGAQLSIRLAPGSLNHVLETLESNGVVVDERKPDVIRVAPALYNSFEDVFQFCHVFEKALTSKASSGERIEDVPPGIAQV